MPPNPFIELARDPIATLGWLGYFFGMVAIVVALVPWAIRHGAKLIDAYYRDRKSDDWWAFGDARTGYIPPGDWLLGAFKVLAVLAVASWALGSLVWLVGV